MPVMSSADIQPNRRGVPQLVRHWPSDDGWASLLVVHGLGEHSGRYEALGSTLADAGIDTHAFDLVGFGGSGGDRAHLESWSHYLEDIADRLTPALSSGLPTVLMGMSLGGLIVATYALSLHRQPDLLVLSAPALDSGAPGWQKMAAPGVAKLVPKLRLPNFWDGEMLSRDPAVGEAYYADPLVETKTSTRLGSLILAQMTKVNTQNRAITQPLYVFQGGDDQIVPPEATVVLGELPNATRRVYPGLRHETVNEPEGGEVLADVIGWIRAQVGTGG